MKYGIATGSYTELLMELLLASWIFMGGLTSYLAKKRGRHPGFWFLLGAFFGIFSIIALYLISPLTTTQPLATLPITLQLSEPDYTASEWFYADKNYTQQGPISYHDLMMLWNMYNLNTDSYVWREGMAQWQRFGDVFNKNEREA